MSKIVYIIFTAAVVIGSIIYKDSLEHYYKKLLRLYDSEDVQYLVYSSEELSKYDGQIRDKVYLAIMGIIFDVTRGIQHYGKGSPYNYFVGKDGTRAFITGNFKDESDNKDHILDLTCDELLVLENWKKTFTEKYKFVGYLTGRYIDNNGLKTEYMHQFLEKLDSCKQKKQLAKKEDLKYPPCNISWNAEDGTRVWCTKSSGGITRKWIGVPRQMYTPGEETPRCVCVNIANDKTVGLYKEFDNCSNISTSCNIEY